MNLSKLSKPFVLQPFGGMCNRLRAIMCYYYDLNAHKRVLYVRWIPDRIVSHAEFSSVFEPLNGVVFVKTLNPKHNVIKVSNGYLDHKKGWTKKILHRLRPKKNLQIIIDNLKKTLDQDYIAVHVRRTDMRRKIETPDNVFFDFIDAFDANKPIFLATDNGVTQQIFKKRYGDRIIISNDMGDKNTRSSTRISTLADAVIDLFVCIYSGHFLGTKHSSFSNLIMQYKQCL